MTPTTKHALTFPLFVLFECCRMIDNVLRDLIEEALELARDDPPREEPIEAIKPTFSLDIPDIVTVQPSNDGMMLYVGTKQGKLLCINTLRGEQVGNPIDLEDTIKCLALAADGRILAVAVGGAKEGDEAGEPTPSTVKLMLVLSERPFLKTVASTPLIAEAVELHLSFDSQVFAALLKTNQLECYSTTISIPLADEAAEPLSSPVKTPHTSGQSQLQGDEDGDEKQPPGTHFTTNFTSTKVQILTHKALPHLPRSHPHTLTHRANCVPACARPTDADIDAATGHSAPAYRRWGGRHGASACHPPFARRGVARSLPSLASGTLAVSFCTFDLLY